MELLGEGAHCVSRSMRLSAIAVPSFFPRHRPKETKRKLIRYLSKPKPKPTAKPWCVGLMVTHAWGLLPPAQRAAVHDIAHGLMPPLWARGCISSVSLQGVGACRLRRHCDCVAAQCPLAPRGLPLPHPTPSPCCPYLSLFTWKGHMRSAQ